MVETHPYGEFVPKNARFLILGSFPGKPTLENVWFYGSTRNQFWRIIENVYGTKLTTTQSKKKILTKLRVAMADIIYSCVRKKGTNLDNNLTNIVFNIEGIAKVLSENKIEKIFFSSRFVENKFRKLFKKVEPKLITLPSPSPRYAKLNLEEKTQKYKAVLPKLQK